MPVLDQPRLGLGAALLLQLRGADRAVDRVVDGVPLGVRDRVVPLHRTRGITRRSRWLALLRVAPRLTDTRLPQPQPQE